ncbi:MAG: hypothetical protein ACREMB_17085 [Candidatus Rokuibacteriota bacterium]
MRHARAALPLGLGLLLASASLAAAAAPPGPAVGAWATYRWTSSMRQDVPVLVTDPSGQITLAQESTPPPPLFVTYAVVRADARSYTLQIVTRKRPDDSPLAVTQVRIDRGSGKALRSVTQRPNGVIETPESGLRPFHQATTQGTEEQVAVPSGRFTAVRAGYRGGTVWVSDQVPPLGLVKATFPNGTLELVRHGTSGAKDLLRS